MHGFIVFRDLCEYVHDGRKFYLEAHGFNPFDVGETLKLSCDREPLFAGLRPKKKEKKKKKKKKKKKTSRQGGSNPRSTAYEAVALPLGHTGSSVPGGKKKYTIPQSIKGNRPYRQHDHR